MNEHGNIIIYKDKLVNDNIGKIYVRRMIIKNLEKIGTNN